MLPTPVITDLSTPYHQYYHLADQASPPQELTPLNIRTPVQPDYVSPERSILPNSQRNRTPTEEKKNKWKHEKPTPTSRILFSDMMKNGSPERK